MGTRSLVSLWNMRFSKDTLDGKLEEEIGAAVESLADRYESEGMSRATRLLLGASARGRQREGCGR
jgi:hypothetical protein